MRKLFFRSLLTVVVFLQVSALLAQQEPLCPKVQSLTINTGYNPVTNTVIAVNQPDPRWRVTAISPLLQAIPGVVTAPANARVIQKHWLWASGVNSNYISCLNSNLFQTVGSTDPNDSSYRMTVTRTFQVCSNDVFSFNLNLSADNRIMALYIDNGPSEMTAQANIQNFSPFNTLNFSKSLVTGTHTLNIVLQNSRETVTDDFNYFGLNVYGSITGTQQSLLSPAADSTCNCAPPPVCDDVCFWKLDGNSIANGYNRLGTTSPHDIRLISNNVQRGIIGSNGNFGWGTASPSTLFHINCTGTSSVPSKLRFEGLPVGPGTPLMVDANGYVLKGGKGTLDREMEQKLAALTEKYAELEAKMNRLMQVPPALGNNFEMDQNVPNPFTDQTVINYYLPRQYKTAFILVTDLSGKELSKQAIHTVGRGKLTFQMANFSNGMYLYSLVVDNAEVMTRKMVISR